MVFWKDFVKCTRITSCIGISNQKIFCLEKMLNGNVLLLTLDSLNLQILTIISLLDVELLDMWLQKLSTLKIWKLNILPFVIFTVWVSFSIFFFLEKVHSQEQLTMRFFHKIELQILTLVVKNTKKLEKMLWIYLLWCWKKDPLKE